MHLAQPHKLRLLQTRNQAQHIGLRPPAQIGLKTDHVVQCSGYVVLAQLYYGIWASPRTRIGEPNGAHGAKGQRLNAAAGQHFHRHTAFKVALQLFIRRF